ncbi:MAG: hypothetical protein ABIU63_00565 [Chitinophagaceae bacterium]
MNTQLTTSRVQMEAVQLQQLVAEVRETIAAVEAAGIPETNFKAIDLWNIRRTGRYAKMVTKRKKSASLSVTHLAY